LSKKKLRQLFLEELNEDDLEAMRYDWPIWARLKQRPPLSDWRTWLVLGGRGAGKTRTGAQWLKGVALGDPHYPGNAAGRIALVGQSYDDVRDVMVEGESGLLAIHKLSERPQWISSRRELIWDNGTVAKLFSSADPDGLRGSQFGAAWCDELCKWSNAQTTWDMLQFALRLGDEPRQVVTTTPKPVRVLKQLLNDPATITVRSTTQENQRNLASGFLDYVNGIYGGTRLGRQELEGEILEAHEHALWKHEQLDGLRVSEPPELSRIVIAVDPPAGSGTKKKSAACGIIAVGKTDDNLCYVLADKTLERAGPNKWAREVVALYHLLKADLIVAEANQGGDMVRSIIHATDESVPVRMVHASRAKWVRAEPVALLYERGQVRHVGTYPELEDQMCAMSPDGLADGLSPDRVDALVWAVTQLALAKQTSPRIRTA
jgi:phage terminase large subunit-like protein